MVNEKFKFPIVMIDGTRDDSRKVLGMESEDTDYIIGETEIPGEEYVGVMDRWLPSRESYEKAQEGNFEACYVMFGSVGSFLVPWNKEKFKKTLNKWLEGRPSMQEIMLNPEQMEYLKSLAKKEGEDEE